MEISLARFGSRLPVRRKNGTPAQRQLSTKTCSATKVSVRDRGSTPSSCRYPGTGAPAVEAGGILRPDHLRRDRCAGDRTQRLNHFQLFVAHDVRVNRSRRLRRHQRDELEDVILHHVAQCARLLVIAGALADPFFLRHRDLDVIDVLLIEQRFEDAVGEAEHENVLDRFLTQIVIDAVDLPLVEDRSDRVVDRSGRGQIASDGLLDDQPRERRRIRRADEPRRGQVADRRGEHRRRHRQIVDAVAGQAALVLNRVQACAERSIHRRFVDRPALVEQRLGEFLPVGVLRRPSGEPGGAVLGEVTIGLVGERLSSDGRARRSGVAADGRREGCRAPAAACDAPGRRRRRKSRS